MSGSIMGDAFAHHVWATLRLADMCLELTPEQLETSVPGTYGSILDTMRHIVEADASYLNVTSGQRTPRIDAGEMSLAELRSEMERHESAWQRVVAGADPDAVLVRRRDDGSTISAPMSIRLAQALHHGTDHRSQICTGLTSFGVESPDIGVWKFGEEAGTVIEESPP
jgi:uncharacterized damage-inducible protein DinB